MFSLVDSYRSHSAINDQARKAMTAWLRHGGFILSKDHDGLMRKARIISFLQNNFDRDTDMVRAQHSARGDLKDESSLPHAKRLKLNDDASVCNLDESSLTTFNNISAPLYVNFFKICQRPQMEINCSTINSEVESGRNDSSLCFNEEELLEKCRSLSAMVKKTDLLKSSSFATSICELLVKLSEAPLPSLQTYIAMVDACKIPDEFFPAISDEIVKRKFSRKLMSIYLVAFLLPIMRILTASASRAMVKGLEALYRYDHWIIMALLLTRLVCERTITSASSSSNWKPSHTHMELTMRIIRQVIVTPQHKELFIGILCNQYAFSEEDSDQKGRDEARAVLERFDGLSDCISLQWSTEHVKLFQLLCPSVIVSLFHRVNV